MGIVARGADYPGTGPTYSYQDSFHSSFIVFVFLFPFTFLHSSLSFTSLPSSLTSLHPPLPFFLPPYMSFEFFLSFSLHSPPSFLSPQFASLPSFLATPSPTSFIPLPPFISPPSPPPFTHSTPLFLSPQAPRKGECRGGAARLQVLWLPQEQGASAGRSGNESATRCHVSISLDLRIKYIVYN